MGEVLALHFVDGGRVKIRGFDAELLKRSQWLIIKRSLCSSMGGGHVKIRDFDAELLKRSNG